MKRFLYAMTITCLLVTLCACTNMATTPGGVTGETSAPTELSTPAPTPAGETTPAPSEEPPVTLAPERTNVPIPEGFSDAELREKAIKEALEASYV